MQGEATGAAMLAIKARVGEKQCRISPPFGVRVTLLAGWCADQWTLASAPFSIPASAISSSSLKSSIDGE